MAKKSSKKRILILVLVIAVVAVAFLVLKNNNKPVGINVSIGDVTSTEIVEIVTASGKISPVTEVKISPDVSGEIVELNVKEGDYVEKGDLLLRIKPDVYESIKSRTEATVNASLAQKERIEVQLKEAKLSLERNKKLYEQQAITQKEFETAQAQFNSLEAELKASTYNIESSKASLKESHDNLQKTAITAPASGIISKLNVELGERVVGTGQMAGTEILRIANMSEMEANAEINENDIIRVKVGDTAMIEIDAYPNKQFKGVVTAVANSANETTSLDQVTNFKVDIFVIPSSYSDLVTDKSPYPLRPGLSVSIDIITIKKTTLAIPIQAVTVKEHEGKRKEYVFVYQKDNSTVKLAPITTGIQDTYNIEVMGIEEGQSIVIAPYDAIIRTLKDGDKVIVPPSEAPVKTTENAKNEKDTVSVTEKDTVSVTVK